MDSGIKDGFDEEELNNNVKAIINQFSNFIESSSSEHLNLVLMCKALPFKIKKAQLSEVESFNF